jgi:hypothetical protein
MRFKHVLKYALGIDDKIFIKIDLDIQSVLPKSYQLFFLFLFIHILFEKFSLDLQDFFLLMYSDL